MMAESPAAGLPFIALAHDGDRPALVTPHGTLTYRDLAGRVEEAGRRLGPARRLLLIGMRSHVDAVALYLAALRGGHPVILVDAANAESIRRLTAGYDPDIVALPGDGIGDWGIVERRGRSAHVLHPELALLLSTSGSTGSPKLVRLSLANLTSNAESIATALGIGSGDRAITTLPLAYSYGLSVLHSHLQRGASVVLTDRSVIEAAFWDELRATRATSFAGVPYTFDLLDRVGFADMVLPSLRSVTQAGGRLDPASIRRFAELGARRGWKLHVMYGQTEATARMTCLPPALAATRPESIGTPVPGGTLRIDPVTDAPVDAGELVYRGPNVMLGYAEGPADLALGRTVAELRTGDLGRRGADGLYEIVGRRSQFLKIAGLRVELAGVERLFERDGLAACAVGSDEELVVFVEADASRADDLHRLVRDAICVPPSAVRIVPVPELPRLASGKVDRPALVTRARTLAAATPSPSPVADATEAVRAIVAAAFGTDRIGDADSFASLGGDSLSYVEVSLGLEEALGRLPDAWETLSVGELGALGAAATRPSGPWWASLLHVRSIETGVALRALAIVLVVATHIGMIAAPGGAHVLMAVAGYNFARFRLTSAERSDRVRSILRATARVALPAMAWVAAVMLLTGEYELRHLLLVNALVQDELWGNLWFIELLVYISLAMAAVLAVPAVDRAERRWPFAVALGVVAAGLLSRFGLVDVGVPHTMPVLWLFAIGWAASRAERTWQRGLLLAIALASVPGYFESVERNALILAGVLLLIGVPRIRLPAVVARGASVLGAASLAIYLVHWEVWPLFEGWYGVPSLAASLAAGIVLWRIASRAPALVSHVRRSWGRRGKMRGVSQGRGALSRASVGRPQ
jgi:acyl-CoA synthetase (AMP-forming)/AMP-acid ligase II/peptidoglycan/LPS O-acetylase OafA/YrhL/acyl carrier protein